MRNLQKTIAKYPIMTIKDLGFLTCVPVHPVVTSEWKLEHKLVISVHVKIPYAWWRFFSNQGQFDQFEKKSVAQNMNALLLIFWWRPAPIPTFQILTMPTVLLFTPFTLSCV